VANFEQERAVLLRQRDAVLPLELEQLFLAQNGIEATLVLGTLLVERMRFRSPAHLFFDPCQPESAVPDDQTLTVRVKQLPFAGSPRGSAVILLPKLGQLPSQPQPLAARVAALFEPVGEDQPARGVVDVVKDRTQEICFGGHWPTRSGEQVAVISGASR